MTTVAALGLVIAVLFAVVAMLLVERVTLHLRVAAPARLAYAGTTGATVLGLILAAVAAFR